MRRNTSGGDKGSDALANAAKFGLCGGIAGITTEVLFYGFDSFKTIQQAGKQLKVSTLYRGALPMAIIGSGPSFATFFMIYTPVKNSLENVFGASSGIPVLAAAMLGGIPSSLSWVPADVMKKKLMLTESNSVLQVYRDIVKESGHGGLFLGWRANILKDVPFAMLKMSLYESVASLYLLIMNSSRSVEQLSQYEAGGVGFVAGASTAIITNPLDCVNTRIKSGELSDNIFRAHVEIIEKDGKTALFRGLPQRMVMMGVGATVFWYIYYGVKNAFGFA